MNTITPYEEALRKQLENLPAPSEDASWQKMKVLLDKDDSGTAPPFYKNNKLWLLLTLLVFIGGGLAIYSQMDNRREEEAKAAKSKGDNKMSEAFVDDANAGDVNKAVAENTAVANSSKPVMNASSAGQQSNIDAGVDVTVTSDAMTASNKKSQPQRAQSTFVPLRSSSRPLRLNASKHSNLPALSVSAQKKVRRKLNVQSNMNPFVAIKPQTKYTPEVINDVKEKEVKHTITDLSAMPEVSSKQADTVSTKASAPDKKDETIKPISAVPQTPKRYVKNYFLSAGVGLQQSIPVGGQQVVKYNFNGKQNTLSDYIPSFWLHFERENKWFLQAEFNYSSPQLVKALAFSRQTIFNNNSRDLTITTLRLKKTYYNEIPLSFNYYVRRNWSLGVGSVFSWFRSAIVEKEIVTTNVNTQEQSVKTQIEAVKHYTDSFLFKSHTYLLFQTDYQWRRFTFGFRYTRDVQPYIRYTLPNGIKDDEKNWSLELLVRFRLWRSGLF